MRLRTMYGFGLAALLACASISAVAGESDPLKRAGSLGTRLGPVEPEDRETRKLPAGVGVKILEVIPESAAAEAGLKEGDIVTAFDTTSVKAPGEFAASVSKLREGEKIRVDIDRDGERKSIDITLKARPKEAGTDSYEVIYGSVTIPAGRLRTIMTRPKMQAEGEQPAKRPAVMLIQGVGGYSIEIRPGAYGYAPMIEAFSKAGFVTFRVEKPGQGDSEGGPTSEVDFDTELAGYLAGLKALKADENVDAGNVFLFGHSMGGVMAPLIARDEPVKGISVYGTVVKTWPEYMLENVRRQMELAGEPASAIDSALKQDAALSYLLFLAGKSPKEVAKDHPELAARLSEFFADGEHYVGRSYRFFQQLAGKNMPEAWEGFDGHVLSVWGKNDFVSAEDDHARIAAIVDTKNPGHGKFVAMEGLDHGMMRTASPLESFQAQGSGGEYDPAYHELLVKWAQELANPAETKAKK